jgi:hypothetical protein
MYNPATQRVTTKSPTTTILPKSQRYKINSIIDYACEKNPSGHYSLKSCQDLVRDKKYIISTNSGGKKVYWKFILGMPQGLNSNQIIFADPTEGGIQAGIPKSDPAFHFSFTPIEYTNYLEQPYNILIQPYQYKNNNYYFKHNLPTAGRPTIQLNTKITEKDYNKLDNSYNFELIYADQTYPIGPCKIKVTNADYYFVNVTVPSQAFPVIGLNEGSGQLWDIIEIL